MAQLEMCWPCKHEDQMLSTDTYIKKVCGVCACNPSAKEVVTKDSCILLAGSSSPVSKLQVQ